LSDLSDDVLYFEEIRAKINMHEESIIGIELDICTGIALVSAPRIFHPRYTKISSCKEQEATEISKEKLP